MIDKKIFFEVKGAPFYLSYEGIEPSMLMLISRIKLVDVVGPLGRISIRGVITENDIIEILGKKNIPKIE